MQLRRIGIFSSHETFLRSLWIPVIRTTAISVNYFDSCEPCPYKMEFVALTEDTTVGNLCLFGLINLIRPVNIYIGVRFFYKFRF